MAREIKLVQKVDSDECFVRNIQDTLSGDETIVAARWQDGEVFAAWRDNETKEELLKQAEALGKRVFFNELHDYIARQWGDDVAGDATHLER